MANEPAKPAVLITGASGLIGSKVVANLAERYHFHPLDIADPAQPVDITNPSQVEAAITTSPATTVVHLAAYTDVTGAWKQNGDQSGLAYQVNVVGTQNIAAACQTTGKHLIHVSTAYVFDGAKAEPYRETDPVNPIEWYGHTKAEAETVVQNADCPWTIFRIDQPFRSDAFPKPDLVRKMAATITSPQPRPLFTNHFFGPTFIDDFVRVINWAIQTTTTGLFHATSGEQWTDFAFGQLLQESFHLDGKVLPGDLHDYLKTLDRPYQQNTALDTSKLQAKLPFVLHRITDAVAHVKLP